MLWTVVVVIVIVAVGLWWYGSAMQSPSALGTPSPTPSVSGTPVPSSAPTATPAPGATPKTAQSPAANATPAPKSFTVNGNDSTADVEMIMVAKGTPVTITFGADAQGTYHGGLDFRSSVVSTGPIAPGSTKTVSFTANSSFSFTPYWPSTNIAKPYTIQVMVQ